MYWSIMVLYYSPPFESCAIYFHCGVNDLAVSSFQKKTKKSMGLWETWTTGSHAVLVISHYSLSIWQIQWISKKTFLGSRFLEKEKTHSYSKTAWHCSKLARLDKCTIKIQQWNIFIEGYFHKQITVKQHIWQTKSHTLRIPCLLSMCQDRSSPYVGDGHPNSNRESW